MASAHAEPNYLGVFWWLLGLTIVEIAVIYTPIPRLFVIILLVGFALAKATLVAMYFMHLKFERPTLTWIALSPIILCIFLILVLIPGMS